MKTNQGVPDKYIESYLWVKKCIERGSVIFTPLVYKNPGGRRPGEECAKLLLYPFSASDVDFRRTQFSDEDEENLCNWIASKIPYKETGGRTGNRLYQQLCDLVRITAIMYLFSNLIIHRAPIPSMHGLLATPGSHGGKGIKRMRPALTI